MECIGSERSYGKVLGAAAAPETWIYYWNLAPETSCIFVVNKNPEVASDGLSARPIDIKIDIVRP